MTYDRLHQACCRYANRTPELLSLLYDLNLLPEQLQPCTRSDIRFVRLTLWFHRLRNRPITRNNRPT